MKLSENAIDQFVEETGLSAEDYSELFEQFKKSRAEQRPTLSLAFSNEDFESLKRAGHDLIGVSRTLRLVEFCEVGRLIEKAAIAKDKIELETAMKNYFNLEERLNEAS